MLKSSEEWAKEKKVIVLDPDGWDRTNYDYSWSEEKIDEAEFDRRVSESTTILRKQ